MMTKIPFLIRKMQCPGCILNGRHDNPLLKCTAHDGIYPCIWFERRLLLLPITICASRKP